MSSLLYQSYQLATRCLISLSLLLLTLFSVSLASAQQTNPLAADPRAARAGGTLFRAQCATCHGADAKGISSIDAPDLTLLWTQSGITEERVFTRIRDGVPGSIMPAHDFLDTEIWMLVSFLQSVGVTGSTEEFTGNSANGEPLFVTNCSECHRLGGYGGSLGPNLSRITLTRSQEALRTSIREPNAIIARLYKPISFDTGNNSNALGVIKSEDAFSIQIMDSTQRLRGLSKSELISIDRNIASLMPVFSEQQLSNAQLNDILGFLNRQR